MKITPTSTASITPPSQDERLMAVSRDMEKAFLFEMLKHTGIGEAPEGFGGGVGEEQFASLLQEHYAQAMVDGGGIGLAAHIYSSLKAKA